MQPQMKMLPLVGQPALSRGSHSKQTSDLPERAFTFTEYSSITEDTIITLTRADAVTLNEVSAMIGARDDVPGCLLPSEKKQNCIQHWCVFKFAYLYYP